MSHGKLVGRDPITGIKPATTEAGRVNDELTLPRVPRSQVVAGSVPKRWADRALALVASSSRSFGAAVVLSAARSRSETLAMSSTACWKATSLTFDGAVKPLIFRTYCSAAARISSSVAGGSKL